MVFAVSHWFFRILYERERERERDDFFGGGLVWSFDTFNLYQCALTSLVFHMH